MRWIAAVAICLVVSARARADDWGARRDPFDAGVVRRYKEILARDPHDVALGTLVSMYQRYRTVAKLEAEYLAQLYVTAEDWATLVVLARLPRTSRTDTLALWNRALKANPKDALGWLAFGDLAVDAATARDAYQRAVNGASLPRDKRVALTKLLGAARSAGDAATLDATYVELIALAPKDGGLWLERGNAQLANGRFAAANESFTTAESLLVTDPERRLNAMMNEGVALERLGRADDAVAQYVRALDKVPRGYYLGGEIVARIIDAERRRHALPNAMALFEKRWPEKSRGHFEWSTLGDLYKEAHDDESATTAYKRAVDKAPTEVETQRKLIAMLDKVHPQQALAQHEAAARIAPGDANLQIELAKRYHPIDPAKALATLDRLSKRMSHHVNVRSTLADLFTQWEQPKRALVEYEALAALEPNEPDHAIVLGDAYWREGDETKARAAWQRLDVTGTAASLFRHGEVLAMHELWNEALIPYTKSLALDGTNADTWRGRARAYDELKLFPAATADAQRAVALIGYATREVGDRERFLLVRVLGHWEEADPGNQLAKALVRWRFAFQHGDVGAGYLLAAHHGRIGSHQLHEVLVELYRRVPTDDSLGIALSRSFVTRRDFKRAREVLEPIGQRTPARAKEIVKLVAQVEEDRVRAEQEIRWEEEGGRAAATGRAKGPPDIVGKRSRLGMRLELGTDIRQTSSALLGVGLYRMSRLASHTALATRLEWIQRDDQMEEVNAIALSVGVSRRVIDTRRFEVAAGIAPRFEIRYGSDLPSSSWDRAALGADATLELLPRALPSTLGIRFHQTLTDSVRSSALLLELGFEVR